MIKNKKVIIFDVDGTLLDSVGAWNKVDEELIRQTSTIDIPNIDLGKERDEILKQFSTSKDPYIEYCNVLREKYKANISKEEMIAKRKIIADYYLDNHVKYKPNAEKVLKYLKEKGYILAIVTTTSTRNIDGYCSRNKDVMEKGNFKEIFSLIITKNDVEKRKPHPEAHFKVLDTFKVKKEECLVIEDALIGVEAAKNAGIEVATIYDKYSDNNREQINQLSDYCFNNFEEMLNKMKEEIE